MLTNKTILIISPQKWNHVFVSKHHYALTLAERGNKIYFLNPIDVDKTNTKEKVTIIQSAENENLYFINHSLFFSYKIKFHSITLFHWLMNFHLKKIYSTIQYPIDIVWSFDLGNYFPFKMLPAKYKIFHPVDEPLNTTAYQSAKGANIIFAVTKEILQRYKNFDIQGFVIDHGISGSFLNPNTLFQEKKINQQIRVGLSGNHTRTDIDWPTLIKIIEQSPEIKFEFWGPFEIASINRNINNDTSCIAYINQLKKKPNVVLHGSIASKDLVKELNRMDAFLICYDILKDQSKGTNYHKVLEYISTGKVIVSNNITAYQDKTDLIQMTEGRRNNDDLPYLFKQIINNLDAYNTPDLQICRKNFAENNTYSKQIDRIEYHINLL